MPPKKAQTEEEPTLGDILKVLKSQSEQLTTMTQKMSQIDAIDNEVKAIKTLVVSLREENKELRSELKKKEEQLDHMQAAVNSLEAKLNSLEQHHRGWGARVLNIPISEAEESNPEAMIEKVYQLALRPILEGAVQKGKLQSVPSADQVLEVAHVLPGKQGQPKPIIMRFYNRNLRNLVFQLKREFAAREPAESGRRAERPGPFRYPIYEDLTKVNLAKMRAIAQDERVQACWTVSGQIRFKLQDSSEVKRVNNIHDPLDKILR
jgi:archaellum component FlaC